ncbi:hypothetical protein I316_04171 [Kwoniella heveanensis BCC8398]|uniref:R3H domain-containing protein n=1 Tax=Kwoniella heveanensis BCC8398 TaxID=1296120 RepID=A0A1B9GT22_9TREE|nr:hypothetical protein I316_04171 [Kwoniella heveanensis BCC8398]
MTTVDDLSAPAPLRLPAILQNPTNSALRQVEAHNAQQRERAAARREARSTTTKESGRGGKGKRVIRRLDNASFASNPHIVQPSRSDYAPPVPLQARSSRPTFPPDTVPRSAAIPSTVPPERDPRSSDSINGAFTLSLKGTRALLRKRGGGAGGGGGGGGGGRRVEQFVGKTEKEIRGWLDGDYGAHGLGVGDEERGSEDASGPWRVIDDTLCEYPIPAGEASGSSSSTTTAAESGSSNPPHYNSNGGRRIPLQHQITALLPPLPDTNTSTDSSIPRQIPCVLEHSRSPAHLSWFIPESFERLVVHLICRYYELLSWSEHYTTTSNEVVRLTHIIVPSIAKPTVGRNDGYYLLTPETSELSGQSGPESVGAFTSSESDAESGGMSEEGESDTATERGDGDDDGGSVDGYEVADTTITSLPSGLDPGTEINISHLRISSDPLAHISTADPGLALALERTISNTSSAYASSEGGSVSAYSDTDYTSGLGDSYVLPPRGGGITGGGVVSGSTVPPPSSGWSDFGGSDLGEMPALPVLSALGGRESGAVGQLGAVFGKRGWESKPTFFEYLYGA